METRTFFLDQAQIEGFGQNWHSIPWTSTGSLLKAEVEVRGVTLELIYEETVQSLRITIVRKPFYVSADRVWSELDKYLKKGELHT